MKTSISIVSAASLEIPWPVVVIMAFAALVFLWLILRKGFVFHFKGRDKEIAVSTQNPPQKPRPGFKKLSPIPSTPKPEPDSPSDKIRA